MYLAVILVIKKLGGDLAGLSLENRIMIAGEVNTGRVRVILRKQNERFLFCLVVRQKRTPKHKIILLSFVQRAF